MMIRLLFIILLFSASLFAVPPEKTVKRNSELNSNNQIKNWGLWIEPSIGVSSLDIQYGYALVYLSRGCTEFLLRYNVDAEVSGVGNIDFGGGNDYDGMDEKIKDAVELSVMMGYTVRNKFALVSFRAGIGMLDIQRFGTNSKDEYERGYGVPFETAFSFGKYVGLGVKVGGFIGGSFLARVSLYLPVGGYNL